MALIKSRILPNKLEYGQTYEVITNIKSFRNQHVYVKIKCRFRYIRIYEKGVELISY